MSIADRLKFEGRFRSAMGLDNSLVGADGMTDKQRAEWWEAIRAKRIDIARSMAQWTELDAEPVERRPFLVSASTDELFTSFRGTVFAHGSANLIEQTAALCFVVTPDRELHFYERQSKPRTYTELLELQTKRRR